MYRTSFIRSARLFSTNARLQKSATETVKDAAKAVDRSVSNAAVKGIEKGEQAADAVKSTTNMTADEATGKASELTGEAKGKASELTGEAKGKAHEVAGGAKGKAEEVKRKM